MITRAPILYDTGSNNSATVVVILVVQDCMHCYEEIQELYYELADLYRLGYNNLLSLRKTM